MVVQLVVRVNLDTMQSKVLYPVDEENEERVALLVGIAQLVKTALQRGKKEHTDGETQFMKSEVGTVGYAELGGNLYICEADSEGESTDVLNSVLKSASKGENNLETAIKKSLRKRGREISSLWG
ncbi:MAG: hypothetical protein ACTSUB_09255 [Candidatus Thorarchaeota archaeon]